MPEKERNKSGGNHEDDWIGRVGGLADQVKVLALNLAINLARAKAEARELIVLEPQFTRLIHGSVEVIREITVLLNTLGNMNDKAAKSPVAKDKMLKIDATLNEILTLSNDVQSAISKIKKKSGQVDKYK